MSGARPRSPAAPGGAVADLRRCAHRLTGADSDYDGLLDLVGDSQIVLLGEASHGTHEFYRERARITRRLIEERGFGAVAVEADWPDAYRVNRYVLGAREDRDAEEALGGFRRFPTWMWRNADVLDFVGWLRAHNDRHPGARAGFYGLDLYSLYASVAEVIAYLEAVDPEAAERARQRYACFEPFAGESQEYGRAVALGVSDSCRRGVLEQLTELQRNSVAYLRRDGLAAEDDQFFAEQNARLVVNAEEYYSSMFSDAVSSWNLRDRHMADTLTRLVEHLERHGERARVVVWEHNSHIGDARETEMGRRGELNVGQLVRQTHGAGAVLVGFTTHAGNVTAASAWDGPAENKVVRPSRRDSHEALLHAVGEPRFWVDTSHPGAGALSESRLERAIGVIYRPESERASHYFGARMGRQFDAVVHIDRTRAVEPLERTAGWELGEPPETYPTAL